MASNVERIKEKLGIVDVVSSYIKITKAGKNFKGRCPFHNEKTPSFFVSPERDSFYCFGCSKGGDIFTFVEEFEGLDFLGAMKVLADKAGVEIKFTGKEFVKKEEKDKQYVILDKAAKFYQKQLKDNKEALKYLHDRGLKNETIELFRLGFAPPGWHNLDEELLSEGYDKKELKDLGILGESKGKHYDFFRERIIFPIMDSAGRVVAFTGRVFGENDSDAKYINSQETHLYNKSKILYGFDKAKFAIRKNDFAILVEGNMDVIMSHQAGYRNAVAVSGTSLTEEHVEILKRLTSRIVFAFDSDNAGLRASGRGAKIALGKGIDLKVARLKEGEDPADVIKKNPKDWTRYIKESKHIVDYYLDVLSETVEDERKFGLAVREEVLPYVAMIGNLIDQSHFVKRVASKLHTNEDVIWKEVEKIDLGQTDTLTNTGIKKEEEKNTRLKEIKKRIAGILLWKKEAKDEAFLSKYEERINKVGGGEDFLDVDLKEKENLIAMAEFSLEESEVEKEMEELILNFEEEFLREKREELLKEIRSNDDEALLKKVRDISKRIEELKSNRH